MFGRRWGYVREISGHDFGICFGDFRGVAGACVHGFEVNKSTT